MLCTTRIVAQPIVNNFDLRSRQKLIFENKTAIKTNKNDAGFACAIALLKLKLFPYNCAIALSSAA